MPVERCWLDICFAALNATSPNLFSFPDFLAGLALMVLAWTIADFRYRFRIRVAPIPLRTMTFAVVASVGILTLLTDLWRSEGWLVPKGHLLTPATWQAILAGIFLLTFLTWAWFAFIRPSTFSKWNAKHYAKAMYQFILKGSPTELSIVADELIHSVPSLITHASNRNRLQRRRALTEKWDTPTVEAYANDLLLLIADKRLCRAIVASSPVTALAIFEEIKTAEKYDIQIGIFARNIVNEALANKDSFLYHEAEGYESGLIGYHKPLSQAMFSNYKLVESVNTMLDPNFLTRSKWDSDQWDAYCRIVLMTFKSYVSIGGGAHSFTMYRAFDFIKEATYDLYKLDGADSIMWDNDPYDRLRTTVRFIKNAIDALEKDENAAEVKKRIRKDDPPHLTTFYDHIANLIFEVIFDASAVKSPRDQCWWIQHNAVWGELFNFGHLDEKAGKIVKFKVRRLLFDAIFEMERFPNFKGAKILGFCLNVLGLSLNRQNHDRDSVALHKTVLSWTRKNFAWLHEYNPQIAQACMVDGMTYDFENFRIVRTYPTNAFRRVPEHQYFEVNRAQIPPNLERG